MRVLDIDLDFFLTDTCPFAAEGCRPDDSCAQPFPEETVRAFLENGLGLSKDKPIPGRVFETHDGAAFFWKELICSGKLTVPFDVTHVDAHSDLGIAQKDYPFVRMNVLGRPVEKRAEFEQFKSMGQINEANYLVFAIANRWIRRLENLRNLKSKKDFPETMRSPEGIRLESAFPMLYESKYGKEPEVTYAEYADGLGYKVDAPFDFASLAISPRYAPKSADSLVKVISEYFTEI